MRPVAAALCFAAALAAQNPLARPNPFIAVFQGDQVVLDLKGAAGQYTGTLTVNGTGLATTVKSAGASATGTFAAGGTSYSYTLTTAGRGFVLNSEGNEYRLERKSESPTTPAAPAGSIVGYCRNPPAMPDSTPTVPASSTAIPDDTRFAAISSR